MVIDAKVVLDAFCTVFCFTGCVIVIAACFVLLERYFISTACLPVFLSVVCLSVCLSDNYQL